MSPGATLVLNSTPHPSNYRGSSPPLDATASAQGAPAPALSCRPWQQQPSLQAQLHILHFCFALGRISQFATGGGNLHSVHRAAGTGSRLLELEVETHLLTRHFRFFIY